MGERDRGSVLRNLVSAKSWGEWWDDYFLVVLAVLTWVLLITAAALDHLTAAPHAMILGLYFAAYLTGGTLAAWKAGKDLMHGHLNVDLLMVTAAIGAAIVDAWAEGAVLLALFASSNALEHFAVERTRDAVKALMALVPESVTVLRNGQEVPTPLAEIRIGDVALVRPGERIAIDGVVLSGKSEVDQATITGESTPIAIVDGDTVFAGTMNLAGALQIEASTLPGDTTLARIVRVVSDAREKQGRAQRFAEEFEGKYAVGVLVFAALLFLSGWIWQGASPEDAFYRAMTVLVVMSPCALVISTPASTLSGLANAARHGILFKGGAHLETAGSIGVFAFDKTGTLTTGVQTVTNVQILAPEMTEDQLLVLAASVERLSEHHIAAAIMQRATECGLAILEVSEFDALPGRGVAARVNGEPIAIGNQRLLDSLDVTIDDVGAEGRALQESGKTVVFVMNGHRILGLIAVADSWITDGHKWLNVPYDSGFCFIADSEAHRSAMSYTVSYIGSGSEFRDTRDWNIEMSRRARGFTAYAAIRSLGRKGIADLVDQCCQRAMSLTLGIGDLVGAEVLCQPVINQGLVRFLDPNPTATEADHDRRTDQVLAGILASGEALFGGVVWNGKHAMRISVSNWRTNDEDINRTLAAIQTAIAAAVPA